jgi:hypothetical protein
MITLDINPLSIQSSAVSREIQAAVGGDATAAEIRRPARGVASDPVEEWLDGEEELGGVSSAGWSIELPDLEWTADHERGFAVLAGREAVGDLSRADKRELERLAQMRRGMKNPRPGEELVQEYEQRELTRDLIKALDRYVRFHKAAYFAESAEA